jgi:hypothetical protein
MAEFFTGYSNAVPKQTSLSDMVNMASGIQNYQQAQQLNPLQIEKAKSDLRTSQQTASKGEIELSLSQQANQERLNIQNAVAKNPQIFQTNGRFDPNKLLEQLPILAPMTHTDYIDKYNKALETTSKAEGLDPVGKEYEYVDNDGKPNNKNEQNQKIKLVGEEGTSRRMILIYLV